MNLNFYQLIRYETIHYIVVQVVLIYDGLKVLLEKVTSLSNLCDTKFDVY